MHYHCDNLTPTRAADLRPRDVCQLYGDRFADPGRDPAQAFEFELVEVAEVVRENGHCVAIGFEGFDVVGFPPGHLIQTSRFIGPLPQGEI